jgi:glutathione S-transferase
MRYIELKEARNLPGLRLVLTKGLPGPWGMAARAILEYKGLEFVAVAQYPGAEDPGLREWTGQTSAPVAIYNDEPPRSQWTEILFLAERLAPDPPLLPRDPLQRATMFGLAREIAGEQGFGWQRRLMMFQPPAGKTQPPANMEAMVRKYGYSSEAAAAAPAASMEVLAALAIHLQDQRRAGSRYFIGATLTALDFYWAVFSNMVDPLPHAVNPMPDFMRKMYILPAALRERVDPVLMEHRDMMYREYISLPLDFLADDNN